MLFCAFCEISRNIFCYRTPLVVVSEYNIMVKQDIKQQQQKKMENRYLLHTSKTLITRNNYKKCSVKKVVLRNFVKFTGKHLCQGLFFSKVGRPVPETLEQVFSCEFCGISKNNFLTEHLWTTASILLRQ